MDINKYNFETLFSAYTEVKDYFNEVFLQTFYTQGVLTSDKNIPFGTTIDEIMTISICGGAVRDTIFGLPIRDYDFYFIPKAPYLSFFKENILKSFEPNTESLLFKNRGIVKPDLFASWVNKDKDTPVVIKMAEGKTPKGHLCQFMYYPHKESVLEIINNFDLDICQMGWDGLKWYIGTDVDLNRVNNALQGNGDVTLMSPIFLLATKQRLLNFRERFSCGIESSLDALGTIRDEMERNKKDAYFVYNNRVTTNYIDIDNASYSGGGSSP